MSKGAIMGLPGIAIGSIHRWPVGQLALRGPGAEGEQLGQDDSGSWLVGLISLLWPDRAILRQDLAVARL